MFIHDIYEERYDFHLLLTEKKLNKINDFSSHQLKYQSNFILQKVEKLLELCYLRASSKVYNVFDKE